MHLLLAFAAITATPATTPSAAKPKAAAEAPATKKPDVDPLQAMAAMTKLFDKLFPAGPEPDPARLAAARDATMKMFPKGTYAQALTGFMDRTVENVLDMSEADFADMFPEAKDTKEKGKKAKKAGPPSTEPLRLTLARKDPNFEAKVAAGCAFAEVMFVKLGDIAEPKFRDGMARALARKFDDRQLADIRAFLATPTGAAYGREMVGLWFQPDVMRGTFELLPDMMKMMPELAKDGAAFDAQMKGLSKPGADKKPD